MNEIIMQIPPMLTGESLRDALTVLPVYDKNICQADSGIRLMALSDIYNIYIPSQMTVEIYSKLYLSVVLQINRAKILQIIRG